MASQQADAAAAGRSKQSDTHDEGAHALSVGSELAGGSILLTGGLGFCGSVLLEQLLRLAKVKRVYLLVRGKKTTTAAQRVEKLLCNPLFNMLHEQVSAGGANPFRKVVAVQGDLCLPGLGLCEADSQELLAEVTHVIHCAANIELDADIQRSLQHNFFGTQALMQLSAQMRQLRSFVHVSTFFVANHLPRNSVVREQLHPLPLELDGRPVEYREFVSALMAMEPEAANKVALDIMAANNFNSTYAFGKSLTERMVVDTPLKPGVQRAIVRPSLIAGLLGDPYPGFVSGFGGPSGYTMGYAAGFFSGAFSVAFGSDYIMDIIPCDVVAALIVAAAAKASAVAGTAAAEQVPIYHACSAHCHPVPLGTVFDCNARFWPANPPPYTLPLAASSYPVFETEHTPSAWGIGLGRCIAWVKILGCCALLRALGKSRQATMLKNAYSAFSVYNTPRYNRSIRCAVDNAIALRSELSTEERGLWTLVADAAVLSWYPYGYTVFAGVRRLLFRQEGEIIAEGHFFEYKGPDVSPEVLGLDVDDVSTSGSESPTAEAAAVVDVFDSQGSAKDQAGKETALKVAFNATHEMQAVAA